MPIRVEEGEGRGGKEGGGRARVEGEKGWTLREGPVWAPCVDP